MDPDLKPHMWTDVSYKMASEYFPELAALARLGPAQYVCVIYFPGFQGAQARPHPQAAGPGPGRVRRRASHPLTYLLTYVLRGPICTPYFWSGVDAGGGCKA